MKHAPTAKKPRQVGGKRDRDLPEFLPDLPIAEAYGVDPHLLLAGEGDPDLGRLIIALGLVYNDLKGAAHLVHLLKPYSDKASEDLAATMAEHGEAAVGESGGVGDQLARLYAGILRELMYFLADWDKVVTSPRFRALLKDMPAAAGVAWNRVWAVAKAKDDAPLDARGKKLDPDSKMLVLLRNNVSFHYSAKILGIGFRDYFLDGPKTPLNGLAVFADGVDMSSTRFHFADAAAIGAARHVLGAAGPTQGRRIASIGQNVNLALRFIIIGYLERHCGPKRPYRYEP